MTPTERTELQRLSAAAVAEALQRARVFYRLDLPDVDLDVSLRGRCAGQARLLGRDRLQIRINLQLLAENRDDYLAQTIPHEVAHLVVNWQARQRSLRPKPHGPEWQAVMRDCFGLEPRRCHDYATRPARVVKRPYLYACGCREHRLTGIMHQRLRRARRATCRACNGPLQFLRQEP